MKPLSILPVIIASALAGAVLVIACSDDSPGDADAAVCDCPAAEPPLPGRIQWTTKQVTVPAMNSVADIANCPAGAKLLGGGCGSSSVPGGIIVGSAEPTDGGSLQGFACAWTSTRADAVTMTATAICLVP